MDILKAIAYGYIEKEFAGVHALDKLGGLSSSQMETLRRETRILIIDDLDADSFAEMQSHKYGFSKIRPEKAIPDDSIIQEYPIIVTDVEGVSLDDSNGLRFAKHVKKRYPLKQIIISSGQLKVSKYRDDLRYVSMFDGIFDKVKDSSEQLASLLDRSIVNLYDPSFVWRNIRSHLLHRDEEKSDTNLFSVMKMEAEFVAQVLKKNPNGAIVDLNWLDGIVSLGTLTKNVLELLAAIKTIV